MDAWGVRPTGLSVHGERHARHFGAFGYAVVSRDLAAATRRE